MQLYTREDLLKRAWVADARQADLMIDAIAASYNGDINNFNCLINTVANLHWMAEALKCTDPDSFISQQLLSSEEHLQVNKLLFDIYNDNQTYTVTINQIVSGTQQSVTFSYTTSFGNDLDTVLNYFVNQIDTNSTIDVTAELANEPSAIKIIAEPGSAVFTTTGLSLITSVQIEHGGIENIYTTEETPINRCLTDENIQGIILKIERITGSLCGCDVNELVNDSIPAIIKYTGNVYPISLGPHQVIFTPTIDPDFNIQDFNLLDFN